MQSRVRILSLFLVPLGVALSGCATPSTPAREIAQAEAALRGAARDAQAHPDAQFERARIKAALAQRWMAAKDYQPALWLAEQARVDAELAQAQAAAHAAHGMGSAE